MTDGVGAEVVNGQRTGRLPDGQTAVENIQPNKGLIARLASLFEQEEVRYSHWKSNMGLLAGVDGDYDLDLLIEPDSLPRALIALSQLGFKPATVRWGHDTPGISHYYGLDPSSGELIHVHLFRHVLTGESLVKSHFLPLDEMLLQNSAAANTPDLGALRLTSRPAELVSFTLRMFIKYGSLPDLLLLRRKSRQVQQEVRWLLADEPSVTTNGDSTLPITRPLALLNQHLPVIDAALFQRCLETLNSEATLSQRLTLARKVRRNLKPYARHSSLGRLAAYARFFTAEARRRFVPGPRRKNKRLQAGGAIIAFVGAEATGKSTLVANTGRWLGSAFAVQTIHAGKPPSTLLTTPLNLLLPMLRTRLSSLRTSRLEGHISPDQDEILEQPTVTTRKNGTASLVYALRAVTLAWERRQLLLRAARAADKGDIVLCDRYPSDNVGTMDSPRLQPQHERSSITGRLYNTLARLEHRLYQQIPPPDIALRLNVSLETARQRNRDRIKPGKESDAYLISRHRQAQEWRKAGARHVHEIDTNHSLEDTIRAVRQTIWQAL